MLFCDFEPRHTLVSLFCFNMLCTVSVYLLHYMYDTFFTGHSALEDATTMLYHISGTNHPVTWHSVLGKWRPQLHSGRSLKTRTF